MAKGITPSQTVGPYFNIGLTPGDRTGFAGLAGNDLVTPNTVGESILIEGRVTDGNGDPVPDAMIEIWQADGAGRYPTRGGPTANTSFTGFGRSETNGEGRYGFRTVRPGAVPGPDGGSQAPHIDVGVFARGVNRRLFTRIYLEAEPTNESDAVLALVPEARRATLIARQDGAVDGMARYAFDIRLQGDNETVFFEA